jgi:hypothetical protein
MTLGQDGVAVQSQTLLKLLKRNTVLRHGIFEIHLLRLEDFF